MTTREPHYVQPCHQRDNLFRKRYDPGNSAEEDEAGGNRHGDAHGNGRRLKGGLKSAADGVGLDHVSGEAQGDDDQHCKTAGQNSSKPALEGGADIVDRTAYRLRPPFYTFAPP